MGKITLTALLAVFIFLPFSANAVIMSHLTSFKLTNNGTWFEYSGGVDLWEESNLELTNPCYKDSYNFCQYFFAAIDKTSPPPLLDRPDYKIGYLDAVNLKTMGEVMVEFKKKYPLPFKINGTTLLNHKEDPKNLCVVIIYCQGISCYYGERVPGHICMPAPPENLVCNVTGEKVIDHGILLSTDLSGSKASIKLNVNCNMNGSLTIIAMGLGESDIQLNTAGTLLSRLQINNKNGKDGVVINVQKDISAPFIVTSELIKTGEIEAGPFHGSGTVNLAFD